MFDCNCSKNRYENVKIKFECVLNRIHKHNHSKKHYNNIFHSHVKFDRILFSVIVRSFFFSLSLFLYLFLLLRSLDCQRFNICQSHICVSLIWFVFFFLLNKVYLKLIFSYVLGIFVEFSGFGSIFKTIIIIINVVFVVVGRSCYCFQHIKSIISFPNNEIWFESLNIHAQIDRCIISIYIF